ncbi:MAG TPA: DHA2 family efflux MFS transporter permease subunit [Candidatus Binataceae bacterium]|nr:DHA2 family efflux MFS transporter permease subunit [Candidatus Binataceae bacterium]
MAAGAVTTTLGTAEHGTASKWLVTASVMLGTFLSVMDVSVVNVAMPHMMGNFGEDLLTITWVSTSYSIAEIIMITMAPWWTTLLGRKRLFLLSMAVFTAASILAGTAQTFHQIILYRVVQGIGGGSLIPVSQAIARETFPPAEQGMAMAIFAMGVTLAPALGPVVGGWLVDNYGWPWVFYLNVPFAIAGLLMVSAFVHDPPYLKRGIERIDWTGIALLTIGLTAMQIVLERGEEVDWFASHWIIAGTVLAAGGLIALAVWELVSSEPVINFRLFRNLQLSAGSGLGAMIGFVLYGSSFVLPQLTQDLLGYSAYQAGMVLLPRAAAMFLMMPIVGRLYNYVSPRVLVTGGLLAVALSQWWLGHIALYAGFWTIATPLVVLGAGLSLPMVTLSTVSLSSMPRAQMTGASSLYTLARRVAGNIAYAALATLIDRRTQFHRSRLIEGVTGLDPNYLRSSADFTARLMHFGYNSAATSDRSLAMVSALVNRQSTMMAYNDINWLVAMMTLAVLPFVLLLPRRRPDHTAPKQASAPSD